MDTSGIPKDGTDNHNRHSFTNQKQSTMTTSKNIKKTLKENPLKRNMFLGYSQSGNDYEYDIRIRPNRYAY